MALTGLNVAGSPAMTATIGTPWLLNWPFSPIGAENVLAYRNGLRVCSGKFQSQAPAAGAGVTPVRSMLGPEPNISLPTPVPANCVARLPFSITRSPSSLNWADGNR